MLAGRLVDVSSFYSNAGSVLGTMVPRVRGVGGGFVTTDAVAFLSQRATIPAGEVAVAVVDVLVL